MSDRKVHFSVPIHQIEYLDEQWETASRLARDGTDWLRMGLDRQRFKDRIERTAEILNRILALDFRQHIFQERFESFVIPEKVEDATTRETTTTLTITTTITPTTIEVNEPTSAPQEQTSHHKRQPAPQNNRQRRRKKRNNNRRRHRGGHRKN